MALLALRFKQKKLTDPLYPFPFFPGFYGLLGWGRVGQRWGSPGGRRGTLFADSEMFQAALQIPQSCSSQKLAYGTGHDLHPQRHCNSDKNKRFPQGHVHHGQAEDPQQERRVQTGDQPVQPWCGLHPRSATGKISELSEFCVNHLPFRMLLALQKLTCLIINRSFWIHQTAFLIMYISIYAGLCEAPYEEISSHVRRHVPRRPRRQSNRL